MGIFDYVVLGEELRSKLGSYAEEPFQTKYRMVEGYIRVYNGVFRSFPAWRTSTWIKLLVTPGPRCPCEPRLDTVKLEDIGKVERIEISVSLYARVYDAETVRDRLLKLGFNEAREFEEERFETRSEEVGSILLKDGKAELELLRVKDESALLGFKVLLKIRSGEAELTVEPSASITVGWGRITVERRVYETAKIPAKEWVKNMEVKGLSAEMKAQINFPPFSDEHYFELECQMKLKVDEVCEEIIKELEELTINTARNLLIP